MSRASQVRNQSVSALAFDLDLESTYLDWIIVNILNLYDSSPSLMHNNFALPDLVTWVTLVPWGLLSTYRCVYDLTGLRSINFVIAFGVLRIIINIF